MNFRPNAQGTIAMTANGVSQNVALPPGGGLFVRVENAGPQNAFVELTNSANVTAAIPTANGGGFPVFANQPALPVLLRATDTNIACISAGNSTVYFTRGDYI